MKALDRLRSLLEENPDARPKILKLLKEYDEEQEKSLAKMVTLYDWPTSQNCMDCKHGEPVQFINESDLVATCLCLVACTENDGVGCPKMVKKED